MTWKDKLEIGLKDDAPFRRDNLPDFQKRTKGPETKPGDPTRSPEEPGARRQAAVASKRVSANAAPTRSRRTAARRTTKRPAASAAARARTRR